jgi:hypothetical protein
MDSSEEKLPLPDSDSDRGSLSRVQIALDIGGDRQVRITIESLDGDGVPDPDQTVSFTVPGQAVEEAEASPSTPWLITAAPESALASTRPSPLSAWSRLRLGLISTWSRVRNAVQGWGLTLSLALFGLGLGVYLLTRLIGLTEYPIFFFTDEAVQTVLAADLVRDNFSGYDEVFLPTYFKNGPQYNLSLSVYLQVIPYLFFGKSVFVTRAVSVLVTLIAAVAVGLILREVYKIPYWWSGTLLLSISPAWFLHSRTAFETVIATSLYAGALYFYLLYRHRSPRYLYAAIATAGLAFYSYSPAQVYVPLTGLFLALSDARYHWRNRRVVARGLGVMLLVALPYMRFRLTHNEAPLEHLRALGSYWLEPLPVREKVSRFLGEWSYGLSPGYWYVTNDRDLARHVMDGYGHLLRPTLPFAALGLGLAIRRIRQPAYRALILVLLAAPAGAAIVEVGITRLLVFVIPATLLTALGVSQAMSWLSRLRIPRGALALGLFASLALANIALLRTALVSGPSWIPDYGLNGAQYGARQVFSAVEELVEASPGTHIVVSPTWANGTDVVARFFLPNPVPIEMAGLDGYLHEAQPIEKGTLFVLPVYEYEQAVDSEKFEKIEVERILPYPDGSPGFYFVHLAYVEDIEQVIAAERAERAALREAQVPVDGEIARVQYSLLDMGQIRDVFDGDPESVARTMEANPAVFDLDFGDSRRISGFNIVIGSSRVEITVRAWETPEEDPAEMVRTLQGSVERPEVRFPFDQPLQVSRLRLEVRDTTQPERGHVHVWEISLY